MTRQHDASAAAPAADPDARARRLLALLAGDDIDGAIEAGLASFEPDTATGLDRDDRARLAGARRRLLQAWDARERHRARNARLARRAAEREAGRAAGAPNPARPAALPAAAAAALARAKARAGGAKPR